VEGKGGGVGTGGGRCKYQSASQQGWGISGGDRKESSGLGKRPKVEVCLKKNGFRARRSSCEHSWNGPTQIGPAGFAMVKEERGGRGAENGGGVPIWREWSIDADQANKHRRA